MPSGTVPGATGQAGQIERPLGKGLEGEDPVA